MTRSPTWSVVSTQKESGDRTYRFVAYHLALGASEVFLFADDPEDPAIESVQNFPEVKIIRCDSGHWQAYNSEKPRGLPKRQKINANLAYHRTSSDWIIHMDADEFIHAETPISEILAHSREDVVRLQPLEHLLSEGTRFDLINKDFFRSILPSSPAGDRVRNRVNGKYYDIFPSSGLMGHTAGKCFVKTGLKGCNMTVHAPFINNSRSRWPANEKMVVLHYQTRSYDHWRNALDRKLKSASFIFRADEKRAMREGKAFTFRSYLIKIVNDCDENALKEVFNTGYVMTEEKRVLRRVNCLHKINPNIDGVINAYIAQDKR